MSSSNKTEYLSLNSWVATDKPRREDFNMDNTRIDDAIKTHFTNDDIHTTADDHHRWDNPIYIGIYYGNGALERVIKNDCDFVPQVALVFAMDKSISRMNFSQGKKYNYFAIATDVGSSNGVRLSFENNSDFTVTQDVFPVNESEYNCMNESGTAYIYVLFR